jgi:hypothetical protein
MKTSYLRRHEDVSGNSGCGRVAQVAEFDDGVPLSTGIAARTRQV